MAESDPGQEKPSMQQRNRLASLAGSLLLLLLLLAVAGAVIANSSNVQETPLENVAAIDRSLPADIVVVSTEDGPRGTLFPH